MYKIFEVKAVPLDDHYQFFCPFEERTAHFKTKVLKHVRYHYSGTLDMKKARAFAKFKDKLADLTDSPKSMLDYYKFQSLDELLTSYGLILDAGKCNFLCYDLGFTDDEGQMYVTGTDNENYIFGYFGDYLYYNLPNPETIFPPVVLGASAYYGGYGLSYDDIHTLKKQFREELKRNPDIDFLAEFKKGRKSSVNRHFSHYVMSAFLCEEILNRHDFDTLIDLMYTGRKGETFFDKLKETLGVDESNFHETIVRLIHAS